MTPCLKEPEAANTSKASGLSARDGPLWSRLSHAASQCLRRPGLLLLAPLSSCPAGPVPSFVVTTVFFFFKYSWSSIILRFLEERYYVNEN